MRGCLSGYSFTPAKVIEMSLVNVSEIIDRKYKNPKAVVIV
jgi:hypothetical protein